jgi:hypothetical protein
MLAAKNYVDKPSTADGGSRQGSAPLPTLRRLAAHYLLANAPEYDEASQAVIADILASTFAAPVCGALRSADAFSGIAVLPNLVDVCRVTMAERSGAAVTILDELRADLGRWQPAAETGWSEVEATAERLLGIGLFKREIVGPTLPSQVADRVRRVRNIARQHTRDDSGLGSRRSFASRVGSRRWALAPLDLQRRRDAADRELLLRSLDGHTG